MVCFRCRGRRWLLLRESSLDAALENGFGLGWRGWCVPAHDLPLVGSLDGSRPEEIEDTHAVVRLSDTLVTDWAGHFGILKFPRMTVDPF